MNEQKQATPAEELRRQFMDHSTPLTEAGHWARRRIERLEAELDFYQDMKPVAWMVVDPQGGALFFRNAVHHLACTPLYEHPK